MALACDPIFPPPESYTTGVQARASQAPSRSSSDAFSEGGNKSSLAELQLLHKALSHNFMDLRYLASINASYSGYQIIEKDEQIMRSDEVYSTERSLLTLSNLCEPSNFITSCGVATIVFIDNYLRNIPFVARLIGRHVARLKVSMELFLDRASNSAARSATPKTVLWTLYVGGIAAENEAEREWFIAQLVSFCDLLKLGSWEDAERILKSFLWPAVWDFQGILLWQCLENTRFTSSKPQKSEADSTTKTSSCEICVTVRGKK